MIHGPFVDFLALEIGPYLVHYQEFRQALYCVVPFVAPLLVLIDDPGRCALAMQKLAAVGLWMYNSRVGDPEKKFSDLLSA